MNKKEIAEIRRLLNKNDCRISRIAGCYVNGEKEIVMTMKEAFLSLPEEELYKYCDLFKKTLSGTLGKNLINLEFPLEEEKEGGRQHFLLRLRDSELKEDDLNQRFFDHVIAGYPFTGNYLILLAYGVYDIPAGKGTPDELFDASDYMYPFLLCSICPVNLSKPGLCYDSESNSFIEKLQDHMVSMPDVGFLFPAFNDRNTDIHSALYYSRNAKVLNQEFMEDVLGTGVPLSAPEQKEAFNQAVEETFGRSCDFDLAKAVHENLQALKEESDEDSEPMLLDEKDVEKLFARCGADEQQMERFARHCREEAGDPGELMVSNLASAKKFELSSPDVKIQVSSGRTDLIETRIIDGREYIMLPLTDEVEVNGIRIRLKSAP